MCDHVPSRLFNNKSHTESASLNVEKEEGWPSRSFVFFLFSRFFFFFSSFVASIHLSPTFFFLLAFLLANVHFSFSFVLTKRKKLVPVVWCRVCFAPPRHARSTLRASTRVMIITPLFPYTLPTTTKTCVSHSTTSDWLVFILIRSL